MLILDIMRSLVLLGCGTTSLELVPDTSRCHGSLRFKGGNVQIIQVYETHTNIIFFFVVAFSVLIPTFLLILPVTVFLSFHFAVTSRVF